MVLSSRTRVKGLQKFGVLSQGERVFKKKNLFKPRTLLTLCSSLASERISIIMTLLGTSLLEGAGMWPALKGFLDP